MFKFFQNLKVYSSIKPKHVFILLSAFWAAWLYTEISEYLTREKRAAVDAATYEKVERFMDRGDRFTSEDGEHLQDQIDVLRGEHAAHMLHSATFTDMIIENAKRLDELEEKQALEQADGVF